MKDKSLPIVVGIIIFIGLYTTSAIANSQVPRMQDFKIIKANSGIVIEMTITNPIVFGVFLNVELKSGCYFMNETTIYIQSYDEYSFSAYASQIRPNCSDHYTLVLLKDRDNVLDYKVVKI